MQNNQTVTAPDYLTYQKKFTPYKWYKPLLVTLVAGGFFLLFSLVVSIISMVLASNQGYDPQKLLTGGYDSLDAYTPLGAIMSLGSIAVGIPALMIGNRIINARPFSSYSSTRGGFSFSVFFKCFAVSIILVVLPNVLMCFFTGEKQSAVKFTVAGFIVCTVLVPLQCAAEEYVFRGHIMQMFGSWIKIPIIPIILQTVLFAAAHPYNITGVISVAVMGVVLGACAYFTKGLEASCALHIANNMTAFYLTGFGFGGIKTNVDIVDMVTSLVVCCLYLAFIVFADKKLGWFGHVKKDTVSEFNAKFA